MGIKPYKYTYTMPRGKKRFSSVGHGASWGDALSNIHKYHPKRSNIRRVK